MGWGGKNTEFVYVDVCSVPPPPPPLPPATPCSPSSNGKLEAILSKLKQHNLAETLAAQRTLTV